VARRGLPDREPRRKKPKLVALPGGIRDSPARAHVKATKPVSAASIPDKSLSVLARLATEFTAVLKLSDLLEHVLRVLREETGFDSCSLALVDDRNPDFLVIRAASGIRENFLGLAVPRHMGIHGAVMRAGAGLIVPDMHADPRVFRREDRVRSGIYAPLATARSQIGVLSAHSERPDAFTQADLEMLTVVARYVTGACEVAQLHEQLKALAATDSLTGLANRRCFLSRLEEEIVRARRTGRSISVVLLDLDGFKEINDTYGHAKGDEALVRVAEHLARGVRAADLVARFGGDEFVLMMPETEVARVEEILSRAEIPAMPRPEPSGSTGGTKMGFSWGAAAYPQDGDSTERLLQVADRRLYEMKRRLYGDRAPRSIPS
jgi:diguanylate cyclase